MYQSTEYPQCFDMSVYLYIASYTKKSFTILFCLSIFFGNLSIPSVSIPEPMFNACLRFEFDNMNSKRFLLTDKKNAYLYIFAM